MTTTFILPETKSEKHASMAWDAIGVNNLAGLLTVSSKRAIVRYAVVLTRKDSRGQLYSLKKLDEGTDAEEERYSCFFPTHSKPTCDCKGFTYSGHCKHLASLEALRDAQQL